MGLRNLGRLYEFTFPKKKKALLDHRDLSLRHHQDLLSPHTYHALHTSTISISRFHRRMTLRFQAYLDARSAGQNDTANANET